MSTWLIERNGLCLGYSKACKVHLWVSFTSESALKFDSRELAEEKIAYLSELIPFTFEQSFASEHVFS